MNWTDPAVLVAIAAAVISFLSMLWSVWRAKAAEKSAQQAQEAWKQIVDGVKPKTALSKPGNGNFVTVRRNDGTALGAELRDITNIGNVPVTIAESDVEAFLTIDGDIVKTKMRTTFFVGRGRQEHPVQILTLSPGDSGWLRLLSDVRPKPQATHALTVNIRTKPPLDEGRWTHSVNDD